MEDLEHRTMRKVSLRLIPFLIICYFVAYLDRTNVGFAALTMRQDLNISATAYGLGAGIFFLSYFVFEVPSNLALERFGARKWIARIMISWGILSGCMAFIGGEWSFYIVRLLLGAAEAGFFPGIIFYLTLWFPSVYRARIVGMFMAAIPGSTVFGAPLSSALLYLDGVAGLKGWQWMFILEAIPAIILALVVLKFLTDRPSEAHWLRPEEREWLSGRIEAEARQRVAARHFSIGQALTNGRVLALAFVYFGAVATNYGISFWLPQIVQDFGGLSKLEVGLITAMPYAVGLVGMVWWGRRSDAKLERKGHAAFAWRLPASSSPFPPRSRARRSRCFAFRLPVSASSLSCRSSGRSRRPFCQAPLRRPASPSSIPWETWPASSDPMPWDGSGTRLAVSPEGCCSSRVADWLP